MLSILGLKIRIFNPGLKCYQQVQFYTSKKTPTLATKNSKKNSTFFDG